MPKYAVIWSSEALETLDEILEYIFETWGLQPTLEFQNDLTALITGITKNKSLCPKSKVRNLRKCVVSRQTSLIYKFSGSKIQLVTFVDNRSKHKY